MVHARRQNERFVVIYVLYLLVRKIWATTI